MLENENELSVLNGEFLPNENNTLQNTVSQEQINEFVHRVDSFISDYDTGIVKLLVERERALTHVRSKISDVENTISQIKRSFETIRETALSHLSKEKVEEPFNLGLQLSSTNSTSSKILESAQQHLTTAQQLLQNLKHSTMPANLSGLVVGFLVVGLVIGACVGIGTRNPQSFLLGFLGIFALGCAIAALSYYMAKSNIQKQFTYLMNEKNAAENYLQNSQSIISQLNNEVSQVAAQSYKFITEYSELVKIKSDELENECNELWKKTGFTICEWDNTKWENWEPLNTLNPAIGFGILQNIKKPVGGISEESLHFLNTLNQNTNFPQVNLKYKLPALMSFSNGRGMIFKAPPESKGKAMDTIRSIMLRLLATMPPGMVQFTLLDPIALGDNVAAFIPLGKYDDKLVTAKAWSEPQQIEEQLSKITEQISEFIQMRLRNDHATIEEYNRKARVKEPYRILIVADFPANFNDNSARRLVSIAQNGPRCGVYPIVLVDTDAFQRKSPYGFNIQSLEQFADVIKYNNGTFYWERQDLLKSENTWEVNLNFGQLDLNADKPRIDHIIKSIGERAQVAMKVEVPFEELIESAGLTEENYWRETTIDQIKVPLGPHNVEESQELILGKGTAHHGIIIGKTGSGKTNLMDVIITTLAIKYSPDEIEFYLIDLKKGVGFKPYADVKLPHARVIAIDSEREFALSVLRGLVKEMDKRGDMFRNESVDNISSYRKKKPETKMPRILLVVDEFQNLFLEDDQIGRDAAMIFDRLAREGRSFGVHILLGSQSLSGKASNLSSSTLGQIGIRIALMCNDSDARQIMADDNAEARLLSRPGEAIYNAQNGLTEGNRRFQVALFKNKVRQEYLQKVAAKSQGQYKKPVIFEGNSLANLEDCEVLQEILSGEKIVEDKRIEAWMGEPIALSNKPTSARFRRQSGSNLLVVTGDEREGVGILTSALLSLAVQHKPDNADFYILNFTNLDEDWFEQIENIGSMLPHSTQIVGRKGTKQVLQTLLDETSARNDGAKGDGKIKYLFVYGLQRARDLRPEDSGYQFNYNSEKKEESTADMFGKLLREGAESGIYTLVWGDMMSNIKRTLDRRLINEFGLRIGGTMSQNDSQELLDNSAASRLDKPHRAIFYEEDRPGHLEKFRPFAIPSHDWLEKVTGKLTAYHNKAKAV